ncbi:MAG: hypothetical protein JXQ29_00560 [Planctomycetes bacterium]|nr:hypothetical protein [Planctomycetota bacterium]
MITSLCTAGVKHTFKLDHAGRRSDSLPALRAIDTLADYPLVMVFSAGSTGLQWWIMYGKERVGLTMAGGCTGDAATQIYPFLHAGQLIGLVPGIKGAAEYETLIDDPRVNAPGPAVRRMSPQTVGHLAILALVVVGNVAFLRSRRRDRS